MEYAQISFIPLDKLLEAKKAFEQYRPEVRNEYARSYAIAITELEKLIAFVDYYLNTKVE